jgi:hypothetical protein
MARASAPDLVPTAGSTVTLTVIKAPAREAQRKTIQRLMRMQPHIQSGLERLSRRRRQKDNYKRQRAGRMWMVRSPMTRLTRVAPGESFTIFVSPQILPDLRSVAPFLEAAAS